MGNRAVITTRKNYETNGVGVYVHWNGGQQSVEAFLEYCKLKEYRAPEHDNYGWARLCQVIGNFFGGTTSVGIDTCDKLDCNNGDNGVYFIKNWEIEGWAYDHYSYVDEKEKQEMIRYIDSRMPEDDRIFDEEGNLKE